MKKESLYVYVDSVDDVTMAMDHSKIYIVRDTKDQVLLDNSWGKMIMRYNKLLDGPI